MFTTHFEGTYRLFVYITEQLLELHRGQGMDIYWRDAVQCPSEEEYKTMVIRSRFPWVHNFFFMLNSTEHEISNAHKN